MKSVIAMLALVLSAQSALAATAKCDIVEKMGEESTNTQQLSIELDADQAGEATTATNITVQIYFPKNANGELGEINVTTPFVSGRANTNKLIVTDGYQHVSVTCNLEN